MIKRSCLLLVLCALLTVAAAFPPSTLPSAASCFPPPAGLSAWWPGDGTTNDIVSGREAILHNDATTSPGLIGQAFTLDGEGDFVEVPHDPALNLGTGDFTVALWVNFDHTTGEQILIEAWIQRSSLATDPSEGWTLTKREDNVIRLAMSSGTDADTNVDSAPLIIPTDTWIHFAVTRQAGAVTIFMNGQPIASGSFSGNLDTTATIKFGHRGNPDDTPGSTDESGFFLNGYLDEIQLFVGTALSAEQIATLYAAGSAGTCPEEEGDTNEAAAPLPPTPVPAPSAGPTFHPPTVELLYPHLTGGFIALQVEPLQPGWWTSLQWQDAFGHWHDVDGWQGAFNEGGQVLWWVAPDDLGTGPFRWLVAESQDGSGLTTSEAFHLPAHNGEVLHVTVSVP